MQKNQRSNNVFQRGGLAALKAVRKNVLRQAVLAGLLIVQLVVLLFAITAAWYTNVVQTNGLMFETSTWGFEGEVELGTDSIKAAPGDEGVIPFTAVSNSDEVTAVSVNISKAMMDTLMQQRIYFYVDAGKTQSGETVDRIYLSNTGGYTYTMFSQGELVLTESVYNDARLKWQWVYDVLGYYVRGTVSESTEQIEEYLRPIEYDYDEARTTFDGEGNLATIDGDITAEAFLTELSSKDGYPGEIDTGYSVKGYYPVDVDQNGYGVWAYLCSYAEIQQNMRSDTDLGTGEITIDNFTARVTISAQNSNIEAVEVQTAAGLQTVLQSGETAVVKLTDNLQLGETLEIGSVGSEQQVLIDLNGKTLQLASGSYEEKDTGIRLAPGSALTMINGEVQGNGDGYLLQTAGAEVAMSGVTITDVACALYVRDDQSGGTADSRIRLVNCDITTAEEAIYLSGNGNASAGKTSLVLENSAVSGGYIGIMGNGSTDQCGTDIQVIASSVSGTWAGIYQPQKDSVLTVSNGSTIIGYTGLAVKGGTVKILDSFVSGTGTTVYQPSGNLMSGFTDTADGIYIEANYGYDIALEISGSSEVTSEVGYALQVYPQNAACVNVNLRGGTFSSDVGAYLDNGWSCTYAENVGYQVTAEGSGG